MTAANRPGSVLETEKLSGVSRVSLHIASVKLADTGTQDAGANIIIEISLKGAVILMKIFSETAV